MTSIKLMSLKKKEYAWTNWASQSRGHVIFFIGGVRRVKLKLQLKIPSYIVVAWMDGLQLPSGTF